MDNIELPIPLTSSLTTSRSSSEQIKSQNLIYLKQILKKSENLQSFIDHLSHEFSLECILSYIEFTHFKESIQQEQEL